MEVFRPHSQRSSQAVHADTNHLPGNILVFGDKLINGEWVTSHGDNLDQRWYILVQIHLLRRHVVNGNSGWGRGEVNSVLVPSLHLDPRLSDERCIGSEDGLHYGPCIGRHAAPVFLEHRLDFLT